MGSDHWAPREGERAPHAHVGRLDADVFVDRLQLHSVADGGGKLLQRRDEVLKGLPTDLLHSIYGAPNVIAVDLATSIGELEGVIQL